MKKRTDGRTWNELRPVSFETGVQRSADGSVLISFGNTKVICAATIETVVPQFAKEEGKGWLTAEYSMLPASTFPRHSRETKGPKGRTQEIQRLIGRSLRSVVDLKKLFQVSILIDCDVLQADGGTRTASITGAYVAVVLALQKLKKEGRIMATDPLILGQVAAISLGIIENQVYVDLNYEEDYKADVDSNLVMNSSGELIEIQGTAEKKPLNVEQLPTIVEAGKAAIFELQKKQRQALEAFTS